jgi:hypothetical protein
MPYWPRRARPPTSQQPAPCQLDQTMKPEDLVFELTQLQFDHSEFRRVWIDRDARDYLVDSVNARHSLGKKT